LSYVFPPPPTVGVPVQGTDQLFPVHRIYCVGRNYEDHAKEMGFTGREPPFFFMKPADAAFVVNPGAEAILPYPGLTDNFHHEIELVVAIGVDGVYGYAVGLDMTRRDLQNDMKKQGRPWCIGKGFDHSAPIGAITRVQDVEDIAAAQIILTVNNEIRQRSSISRLIWNIAEIIEHLRAGWILRPGDLIFTGTPAGVGAVSRGDRLVGSISGLCDLRLRIG
jgi:fumarylpyruvate hydrolase